MPQGMASSQRAAVANRMGIIQFVLISEDLGGDDDL